MYFRPLSQSMIEKLRECYEMELEQRDVKHCMMENMSYAVAPLYKRGLIDVRKKIVDQKSLHCIFVTKAGINYLKNLEN